MQIVFSLCYGLQAHKAVLQMNENTETEDDQRGLGRPRNCEGFSRRLSITRFEKKEGELRILQEMSSVRTPHHHRRNQSAI